MGQGCVRRIGHKLRRLTTAGEMMLTWLPVSKRTEIGCELMYAVVIGSGSQSIVEACVLVVCSAPE